VIQSETVSSFEAGIRAYHIWNSLPNYVVGVQSIDVFKVRLISFGHNKKLCLTGLQTWLEPETDRSTQLKVI